MTTGRFLLALAVLASAVLLAPELWVGRLPLNDGVFHLAAVERLIDGASFQLDPWVAEWALGYPVWRSYQPLPHLLAALVLWLTSGFTDSASAFAALQAVLIIGLPISIYGGARLLGLSSGAAGLASLLTLLPVGAGELSRYGIGYGAAVWRGTGLFTQVVALHLLAWSLGCTAVALDSGRRRLVAALVLALTALSHVVFGYVGFVSAAILALVGPTGERGRRVVRLATIVLPALVLVVWFVVPLWLARHEIGHSRWEPAFKWDSFGAAFILRALVSGALLDAGRWPVLTAALAIGAAVAIRRVASPTARRLLALTATWLLLFFGRATWGGLVALAGVPADFHLHRLQAAFELAAILLAAWGLAAAIAAVSARRRWLGIVAVGVVALGLIHAGRERAQYLQDNTRWGEANLAAFAAERRDLDDAFATVRTILAERPGRVFAGLAGTWGGNFTVGATPVYALLSRAHFDQVSYLYHAMSRTADGMLLRDESRPDHDAMLAVRAVVAPAGRSMPAHLRLRAVHGRFAVYEASPDGYWSVVDPVERIAAIDEADNAHWFDGPLPARHQVVIAGDTGSVATAPSATVAGRVLHEEAGDGRYAARLALERPSHALLKITWHPDLVARVDGVVTPLERVVPGFGIVAVPAGEHDVSVHYEPAPWKPILLGLGLLPFVAWGAALRMPRAVALEGRLAAAADAIPWPRLPAIRTPATATVLAGTFAALYVAVGPGNLFSVDEVLVQETAQAVASRGTLDTPAMNTARIGRGGAYYAHRGPGLAFVAMPLAYVGLALDDAFGSLQGGVAAGPPLGTAEHPLRWSGRLAAFTALLANAAVGGAIVAVLFLLTVRLTADARVALLLAIVAGISTTVLSESIHFFQHPLEALGLLLGFWFLGARDAATRSRDVLAGGVALGVAMLARPNAGPAAVVLALYGLAVARSQPGSDTIRSLFAVAVRLAIGPAIAAGLLLYFNWLQFGTPFSFGYTDPQEGFTLDPTHMARFVAACVASPVLSVFLFAPPLVLAVATAREARRRWPLEVYAAAGVAAAYVGLFAAFLTWHGGLAFGPRYVFPAIVLALPLAAPAFERAVRGARPWRAAVVVLGAAGVFVQLLGAAVYVGVNQWGMHRLGLAEGAQIFVPAASPIWLHLQALVRGEHLAPWGVRALAAPGMALLLWLLLVATMLFGVRRLMTPSGRAPAAELRTSLPSTVLSVVALLVLLGFSWTRPLTGAPPAYAERVAAEAVAAQRAGRTVRASEDFARLLGAYPADAVALYNLGVLHAEAGRTNDANVLFTRALAIAPDLERAPERLAGLRPAATADERYRLGKAQWDRGDVRAALATWEAGAAAFPEDLTFLRNVALCRYALADYAGAARDLRAVIARSPDDLVATTDLAWALLQLGDHAEAERLAAAVLAAEPSNAAATAIVGRLPRAAASGRP